MNPLSVLYGAVSGARNALYENGLIRAHRLKGPVVSVGNISVGGSGKTPFIIMLGEMLKANGIRFDVLSRGYGRQTTGVRQVDESGTAANFGDEPLLIARRLRVPVIVGESRAAAGQFAEKHSAPNSIFLTMASNIGPSTATSISSSFPPRMRTTNFSPSAVCANRGVPSPGPMQLC